MVSDETAKRIADALERLAAAVERQSVNQPIVEYRPHTGTSVQPHMCYRCIPAHVLDSAHPCKSYGGQT